MMSLFPLCLGRPGRRHLLPLSLAMVMAITLPWLLVASPAHAADRMAAGAAGAAPDDRSTPPEPQPTRPFALPTLHEQRLANGLTVVVAPRPDLPLVSITLLVRAGPEVDPPGHPGVAAMATNLWTKGAVRGGRQVPAAELARQAEALGGALDSHSSWGAGTLAMTVSSPQVDEALALMSDVLRRPVLAADELERARTQALDGLRVTLSNPAEVAALVLRRSFWGDGPYGAAASPAAIKRLTRAEMMAFQALWVRPDRVALVLAGDITPERALALAQRLLGDWRAPGAPVLSLASAPAASLAAPLVLIDMPGSGQSGVAVAAPFVSNAAADGASRYVGLVANAVLGGGYSARLNQEVRIKRGLSYGAFSSVETHAPGGMFSAQSQTQHATAAQVLKLVREQITQLADAPLGASELAARQATLVGGFVRRLETNGGMGALLVGQLAQGRPLAELGNFVPAVLAVTPAQVQSFARQYWQAGALRAVVVGDLGAAGDSLAAAATPTTPATLRLTLGELDLEQAGLRKP